MRPREETTHKISLGPAAEWSLAESKENLVSSTDMSNSGEYSTTGSGVHSSSRTVDLNATNLSLNRLAWPLPLGVRLQNINVVRHSHKECNPFYDGPPIFGVGSLDNGNILIIVGVARFFIQSIHLVPIVLKHDVVSSGLARWRFAIETFILGVIHGLSLEPDFTCLRGRQLPTIS